MLQAQIYETATSKPYLFLPTYIDKDNDDLKPFLENIDYLYAKSYRELEIIFQSEF